MSDKQEEYEERVNRGTVADRRDDPWHIDKSVSVGHIISTIMLAGAMAGFVFSTNTKVEMLAVRMDATEERLTRDNARHNQDVSSINVALQRLEDKVDRLIERENN